MKNLILYLSILCLSAIIAFGQKSFAKPRKFPIGKAAQLKSNIDTEKNEPTKYELKSESIPTISPEVNDSPLTIISKPRPISKIYHGCMQGVIRLRITFLATSEIGKISPVSSKPGGLTDEAIEAALKIKFVPAVKNGKRITVTKVLEYRFQWSWI